MVRVAALFVERGGVYDGLPDVDAWTKDEDARKYTGPYPVVAHPPCQLWTKLARVNYKRWGGEHNKPGNDGGCFLSALTSVRRFGGVLEHPAFSYAWTEYQLPRPRCLGWVSSSPNEWVCEVWQSAYGHRARKRTWLYYYGRWPYPIKQLRWERLPGVAQIGWFDRNKPVLGKREASATPILFRDDLLTLARNAQ